MTRMMVVIITVTAAAVALRKRAMSGRRGPADWRHDHSSEPGGPEGNPRPQVDRGPCWTVTGTVKPSAGVAVTA